MNKPIPAGSKKYRFNGKGEWVITTDTRPSMDTVNGKTCIFECVAISPSRALEKFGDCVETLFSLAKIVR